MSGEQAEMELIALLERAAQMAAALPGLSPYCPFDSPADFAGHLRGIAHGVGRGDPDALDEATAVFAPTGAWDEGVGEAGAALADRAMELVRELRPS